MKVNDNKQAGLTLRQSTRDKEQGFTLIETSIALVVMMIVGLGAASLFVFAMGNNSRGSDRAQSLAVAQEQMEQLRKTAFTNLNSRVTALGGSSRTAYRDGRQYRVVTTIANTVAGDASLETVTVQATPLGDNTAGLTPVQQVYGGARLVTLRATNSLGPYLVP